MYADDIQLFVSVNPLQISSAILRIQSCVEEVMLWLEDNKLVFNAIKTDAIAIGTATTISKIPMQPISLSINGHTILTKTCIKDLVSILMITLLSRLKSTMCVDPLFLPCE